MRDHNGVVVNVNHPGRLVLRGTQRDLVNVVRGLQAKTHVEQLANAGRADEIADNPAENGTLRLHADLDPGNAGDDLTSRIVLPHDGHATYDIPAVEGLADAVPHTMASRVAQWALGDQIDIIAHAADVQFQPPPARSVEDPAGPG